MPSTFRFAKLVDFFASFFPKNGGREAATVECGVPLELGTQFFLISVEGPSSHPDILGQTSQSDQHVQQ